MEFTLLGATAIALTSVYCMSWLEEHRGETASHSKKLRGLILPATLVGLVAGRLAAMISNGVNPLTNPQEIIILRAGVVAGPATIAALTWIAWAGRSELQTLTDRLAPAALAGLAGWHGACVVRDTCLGTSSDLPWALAQHGSSITRHPVDLYASLAYLVIAVALIMLKPFPPSFAAGAGLVGATGVRLLTEPIRASLDSGPTHWYLAGLLGGVALTGWAVSRSRKATPD